MSAPRDEGKTESKEQKKDGTSPNPEVEASTSSGTGPSRSVLPRPVSMHYNNSYPEGLANERTFKFLHLSFDGDFSKVSYSQGWSTGAEAVSPFPDDKLTLNHPHSLASKLVDHFIYLLDRGLPLESRPYSEYVKETEADTKKREQKKEIILNEMNLLAPYIIAFAAKGHNNALSLIQNSFFETALTSLNIGKEEINRWKQASSHFASDFNELSSLLESASSKKSQKDIEKFVKKLLDPSLDRHAFDSFYALILTKGTAKRGQFEKINTKIVEAFLSLQSVDLDARIKSMDDLDKSSPFNLLLDVHRHRADQGTSKKTPAREKFEKEKTNLRKQEARLKPKESLTGFGLFERKPSQASDGSSSSPTPAKSSSSSPAKRSGPQ